MKHPTFWVRSRGADAGEVLKPSRARSRIQLINPFRLMLKGSLAAAVMAVTAPAPCQEVFKDWAVGCDNGRACQTVAVGSEDGEGPGGEMVITRSPAAQAVPEIKFGEGTVAQVGRRSFRLRGGTWRTVAASDIPAMISELRPGQTLVLRDVYGQEAGAISLAGLSAALRYMDDQQRRVGTVTALVASGPKPASAVPPPPALPVVRMPPASIARLPALDRAKLLRASSSDECGSSEHQSIEAHRLDARNTLVLVPDPCNSGAYNFSSVALIADNRGNTRLARLLADSIVVNASYDATTRLLKTYEKNRGVGDCGSEQDFAWDGTEFRLVRAAEMGICRGSLQRIPSWRAKVIADRVLNTNGGSSVTKGSMEYQEREGDSTAVVNSAQGESAGRGVASVKQASLVHNQETPPQGRLERSCYDILDKTRREQQSNLASGVYWIQPIRRGKLTERVRVYCDMKTDGGGWTLVVGIHGSDRNHADPNARNPEQLIDPNGKGKVADDIIRDLRRSRSRHKIGLRLIVNTYQWGDLKTFWSSACEFTANAAGFGCDEATYQYSEDPVFEIVGGWGHDRLEANQETTPYKPGSRYGTVYVHPSESWNPGAHAALKAGGYWGNHGTLWVK